jgi:hypothetical protein
MGSAPQQLTTYCGEVYDAKTRRKATANQLRYAKLVAEHRCVNCADKLRPAWKQRKCPTCLERWMHVRSEPRRAVKALSEETPGDVPGEGRIAREIANGERCARCWLRLPHANCISGRPVALPVRR